MSILIKGMEMPKNCNECPMSVNGYCVVSPKRANGDALNVHETTLWCPLVEVPTPHGRLIDADAFRRRCLEAIPYGFANEDEIRAYNKILGLLKEATTIIEAEE